MRFRAISKVLVGAVSLSFLLAAPAAAKDLTYTATVTVKSWKADDRRAVAQKAADKGCRDEDRGRARITVRKGSRVAKLNFDCVAGKALAT